LSALKSACEEGGRHLGILRLRSLRPERMTQSLARIPDREESVPMSSRDIGLLQRQILTALRESSASRLPARVIRAGARYLFDDPHPIGRDEATAVPFLAEVGRRGLGSAIEALIAAYVGHFRTGDADIARLSAWLARGLPAWGFQRAAAWRAAQAEWRLFDPQQGPLRLAQALTEGPGPLAYPTWLGSIEAPKSAGFSAAAFQAACELVRARRGRDALAPQRRLLEWAAQASGLAYAAFESFAPALVEPWDVADPIPPEHKRDVTRALLAHGGGDPRTSGRQRWTRLEAGRAYRVFLAWLARASVLQFLDIVDESLSDAASRRMWSYRRAFWMSYLTAGYVEEAWVAFGPVGERLAALAAKQTGDAGLRQFGRIERGSGRSSEHCALILKIGDLTIADWSHSGKYNVWRRGDKGAPRLYEREYRAWSLESSYLRDSHTGADTYRWQGRLAAVIKDHTGRSVDRTLWRPEGS